MKPQELQQTFENCASFGIDSDEHPEFVGSRAAMEQEIHYQLCSALAALLQSYGLRDDVRIAFDLEDMSLEENVVVIAREENELSNARVSEIRQGADLFLEKFGPKIGARDVRFDRGHEEVLAEIRYNAGDLHEVLWSLVTQEHPSNHHAMAHLNTLTHLMERVDNYVPAHCLN